MIKEPFCLLKSNKPNTTKGLVLPVVMVFAFLMLTSVSIWYRKVIFHSFLSERLIERRISYKECNSLIPILKSMLNSLPFEELEKPDENYLVVGVNGKTTWTIGRSAVVDSKIVFTFIPPDQNPEPIQLMIKYARYGD